MKFFSNKNISSKLLFLAAILFACLTVLLTVYALSPASLHWGQQKTSKQEVSKSPAAQTAKIELPKQAVKAEVVKKSQETKLSEKWLDPTVDLDARLKAGLEWAEEHVSNAEKKCAAYKKKVYGSDIDPQLKDLLWGAAVVASKYCWEIDTQPAPVIKPRTGKSSKPKAQGLQ